MRLGFRCTILALLAGPDCAKADVLYRYGAEPLFDGRFGPLGGIQEKAIAALESCNKAGELKRDGRFGPEFRDALRTLSSCPDVAPKVGSDVDARAGALTDGFWKALSDSPAPSVDDRARTLMLTYEATDYTSLEWNFCQSAPRYNPKAGRTTCRSNDPHSYLTWGPNGATAGGGREVQLIVAAVDAADRTIVDRSFGGEAAAVRRMLRLPDRDQARSLETYLCGVWVNQARRAAWKTAFASFGALTQVRSLYDDLYRSTSLDGGKIATFYRAYAQHGLKPTEVDYGFFKDRAAQTSPSLKTVSGAIAGALAANAKASPWRVRRAIALHVRPGRQQADRLGRDVAFYIDAGSQDMSQEEQRAWKARGPVRASDVGLSDLRAYVGFAPGPPLSTTIHDPATLTDAERAACPRAVLDTREPGH